MPPPASSLLLALDIGTSSTRAAFFDSAGRRLEGTTSQHTYLLHTTADGGAEIDPAALLTAVRICLEETLAHAHARPELRGRAIAGVGVSCFWHSLVGTDAAGTPVTPVITWADSRCREDAAALRSELSEKAIHAKTGCMLRASFWPAKLKWLRRTQPRVWARVRRWVSPAEWLQEQLTGSASCAWGMATGTGLLDSVRLQWHAPLLALSGVDPAQMNRLSDEPTIIGDELATRFPALRGVPWYPAIGDGAASNLGSGATEPGLAAINVGTSAAMRVMRRGGVARAPYGLFCYRVDAERYLIGGAVSNAGNLRAWGLAELQLPDGPTLEAALLARPGPVAGLTVLPFWNAERAPTWNEDLRGAILGITQHTSALDLFQSITEGTYQRLALIATPILAVEPNTPRFLVSGGIQHSPGSMQRLADVLGQPVYANAEQEASLRGAAIFALEKLGARIPPLRFGKPFRPRPAIHALYAAQLARQAALEKLLCRSAI